MSTEKMLYEHRISELEKKLLQSINDLNNCKRENEDFIHIASHDLQAPLRKLSTFVERLTHKSNNILGEEALLYIEKINVTLAHMRSLIGDLSVLSDIAEASMDFTKCDLNEVMKDTVTDIQLLIKENNADIIIQNLPTIDGNPAQLKAAFKNLLDNSIKFKNKNATPQIVITSELLNDEEKVIYDLAVDKVFYKIEFADNGIGFNQEYSDKILKPFQRLHGKAAYTGNGLGLAICKKIIDNHLGIIYAKGNENSGALFVLILPQTHN